MITTRVEEIQGLYGPFTVAERVLQKAWLRGYFAPGRLFLKSGKSLEVLHPGRWNHQEGPDFINAHLRIDGEERVGDVEVHFSERDWRDHGHSANPAFRGVILHVVLFDQVRPATALYNAAGKELETFVLGRFLREDLEAFAHEDALLEMEARDTMPWAASFLQLPVIERTQRLSANALLRWQQKLHFANKRLQSMGWQQACHTLALEVLGYRRNRVPMAALAEAIPLAQWCAQPPNPDECLKRANLVWRLSGVRPANHPLRRLRDYNAFLMNHGEWPMLIQQILSRFDWTEVLPAELHCHLVNSRSERPRLRLQVLRKTLLDAFTGLAGNSRLDTLMVDAILPLWAALRSDAEVAAYWLHWPVGDAPICCRNFIDEAFDPHSALRPVFNNGLLQGSLQLYFSYS